MRRWAPTASCSTSWFSGRWRPAPPSWATRGSSSPAIRSSNGRRPGSKLAGAEDVLSTEYPYHAGVYAAGERMLAVNRAAAEDHAAVLSDARVAELFRGLDFARVDDQAGNVTSLAREIWRLFLVAMLVALVVEAGLCLPRASSCATDGRRAT